MSIIIILKQWKDRKKNWLPLKLTRSPSSFSENQQLNGKFNHVSFYFSMNPILV